VNAAAPLVVEEVGPSYASVPLGRTHTPAKVIGKTGHALYRPCLRLDFAFRCAYCLAHESEVGPSDNYGGFEVEHFRPKGRREFRRFANRYTNLLWACHACNRAKSDSWPTDEETSRGMRFVDPSVEALGAFLALDGVRVGVAAAAAEPQAAEFMIDMINLNSAVHQRRRRRRQEIAKKLSTLDAMLQVFRERLPTPEVADEIDHAEAEIRVLRGELGAADPWDRPTSCRCP
jgi:hypothetical protein